MTSLRSRWLLGVALAAAGGAVALVPSPAAAQIAAALGRPLPSPDLPVGTVSVRVVAGSVASPVVGIDVTLLVNDAPRVARTDSAGRATFPGLPAGATVIAKALDEDKQEKASEPFTIPDSGGVRVLISTKPFEAGAGGAPFAGGAGGAGMPEPRKLSGEARGEQSDPAGQLTVRVTYNDFKDTPAGVPVALVGYSADDTVSYQEIKTDAAGRVQFADLDRSGGTSYFAMAELPRNGGADRLTSLPVILESQFGVRMALSGEKRDSTAPPVDDFGKADPQVATPAGKVQVVLEGVADASAHVTLIDAATHKPLSESDAQLAPADPSRVQAHPEFELDASIPAGTLDVLVVGGPGQTEDPLKGIDVRVIAANSDDPASGLASATSADGTVRMALQASGPQKAVVTINGRQLVSDPFDLTRSGGKLAIVAHWEASGRPLAMLDTAGAAAGKVVYAECVFKKQHYRSMPVQLLEGSGTKLTVYVFPRVLFQFQLESEVEDELLAVRGRFEVKNFSWAPYRAGPDGLVLQMPAGHKGSVVQESDLNQVSVAQGEGFRIIRPVPPGGRTFHAAFSLPISAGKLAWSFGLPLGAYQSQLAIKKTPAMSLQLPQGVTSEDRQVPQGTYALIGPINIMPKQSMVMTIEGLPSPPTWRAWVQGIVGILVVCVMLGGVIVALRSRRPGETAGASGSDEARRQQLLDELVELERSGANPKRRDQLLSELERLWA